MAHWIIDDHGFGGQYYQCSECGKFFNDLYEDVPDDICPDCGAEINSDENDYGEEIKHPPAKPDELLTNQEAATIIREMLSGFVIPRGYGKTTGLLMRIAALCKAVEVLEDTK